MNRKLKHQSTRPGVTVIEVLFATGIAVFGLVGIASLISVAGRQATDANNSSEGQAAGQVAYEDFVTRGFNDSSLWRWFNDQLPAASRFGATSNFDVVGATPIARGTSVTGPPLIAVRTPNRHAVCLDPYFYADLTTFDAIGGTFPPSGVYRPGLFPYFQDNYNPLNPGSPLSTNLGRLLRVGLTNRASPSGDMMSAKAIDRIFQIGDDIAISISENDKTLATERFYSFLPPPNGSLANQALAKGEYSWFATLCPREPTGQEAANGLVNTASRESMYTLSIVVCKRRDRTFQPLVSPPQGERALMVSASTNFRGGSGGRVVLSAASEQNSPINAVSSSMRIGDWVMLCRQQTQGSAGLSTICRWYRIIAADYEADHTAGTTWSRSVILDGPDWVFDSDPSQMTQAIMVSGVVAVIERVIAVD